MKHVIVALVIVALAWQPAFAWMHAGPRGVAGGNDGSWAAHGSRGGSASGGDGSWNATGYRGGTASGGDGSWHAKGADGGSASGGDGSWHAKGADGGTASGGDGYWHGTSADGTKYQGGYDRGYTGATYPAYHPPTVVNNYYGSGCGNCGGWSAAGAAAAGVAVGVAAGAAAASAAQAPVYAVGAIYTTVPAGCTYMSVAGVGYYDCNGTWFKPSFGANGVYYRVVPAP